MEARGFAPLKFSCNSADTLRVGGLRAPGLPRWWPFPSAPIRAASTGITVSPAVLNFSYQVNSTTLPAAIQLCSGTHGAALLTSDRISRHDSGARMPGPLHVRRTRPRPSSDSELQQHGAGLLDPFIRCGGLARFSTILIYATGLGDFQKQASSAAKIDGQVTPAAALGVTDQTVRRAARGRELRRNPSLRGRALGADQRGRTSHRDGGQRPHGTGFHRESEGSSEQPDGSDTERHEIEATSGAAV